MNKKCKTWKAEYLREAHKQAQSSKMLSQKGIHVEQIKENIKSYKGGYKRSRNKRKIKRKYKHTKKNKKMKI